MSDAAQTAPAPTKLRAPRRRWAKGAERPAYLRPEDIDRVMIMLVALASEVSALRDRLDTHEALAERGILADSASVEAWVAEPARQAAREAAQQAMLKRVLRAITEEREAALHSRHRSDDESDHAA